MRTCLVFGSLWLAFVVALVVVIPYQEAVAEDGDPAQPQDPAAGIEWKKAEGAEKFREAHAAFEAGKYKNAQKLFKKAQGQAKDKASKGTVRLWMKASRGGVELTRLQRLGNSSGKGQEALVQAERAAKEYGKTPIGSQYDKLISEMRERLFFTLENFERKTGRFSKKRGKTFIDDEKMIKEGKRAIRWEINSNPAELKIKDLPDNLGEFAAIWFWIHFPEKGGRPYEVTFLGKGKTEKERISGKRKTNNGYRLSQTPHRGWKLVKLPLKRFSAFGSISWKSVKDFRIRFSGAKGLVVHVDDIVLVRK